MSRIDSNPTRTTNAQVNQRPALSWDVFVTPAIGIVTPDRPPGVQETYFQAMASTPIHGTRDVVFVDAFMTVEQAAYNDVHLYLAESNAQKRREWITALDKIGSLNPRAVVAAHKRLENEDNPTIIEETRQYIRDLDRLAEQTTTVNQEFFVQKDS